MRKEWALFYAALSLCVVFIIAFLFNLSWLMIVCGVVVIGFGIELRRLARRRLREDEEKHYARQRRNNAI